MRMERIYIYLLLILILGIVIRVLIFSKITQIIGTDAVRYAIVAHSMFLKQEITTDSRPYDMSYSFFYFPISFVLPLILELMNINPISSITYFSLFFNIMSILAFYLFVNLLLDKKQALYATFFYSLFYDVSLDYLMARGVFAYSIGFYGLFLMLYGILKIHGGEKDKKLIFFPALFLLLVHWYHFFVILALIFSLAMHEFINENSFRKTKDVIIKLLGLLPFLLIALLPFLILFIPKYFEIQKIWKLADWRMYEIYYENLSMIGKLYGMIFKSFASIVSGVTYSLGFFVTLLVSKMIVEKSKMFLLFLFVFLFISSYFYIPSITWKRNVDYMKLIYPISFSLVFDNPIIVGISLILSPYIPNTPFWYFYMVPEKLDKEAAAFFDVVSEEELKAFEFIRKNTPINATFILDGGGAGCVGGQTFSHGERIFPLTSRKVFYFTNFCPGLFDLREYQERVDLYRELAIEPNNESTIMKLKKYNVTHVYIGPAHIGLNPELFIMSRNYKLIFHENNTYVFEIK
ncbi:MAG: hypothetical protein OH319_00205 [Candidatus Parvarchaeota archaeon]|nr:hypothetical protein [Candidatus Jingweiarchaeum tengchongense]MCW1304999.1 hypothetical protein [Candidatus Jingweiarchaeum tengchongense]MCW1310844.1 hypothetical protein [Candidatus Jingweiarchaeum tengchongense]